MAGYLRFGEWQDISGVSSQHMLGGGVEADVVSYSTMINACAQNGETARAEWWLQHMLDNGVEANVVSYSTVINACAQQGEPSCPSPRSRGGTVSH